MLRDYLKKNNLSVYAVSNKLTIPYTTLRELSSGITGINKVEIGLFKKLSIHFGMSLDMMYEICRVKRFDTFTLFRSEICHKIKTDDIAFAERLALSPIIEAYYECAYYAESFYLLAVLDLISDKYNIPCLSRYDRLRKSKLNEPLIPADILLKCKFSENRLTIDNFLETANPYFLKYNIVEGDIYE